jgi:DNA-binding Lrp family transcriptional regulator
MSELLSRLQKIERKTVIKDCVTLIDHEVASKGGLSGAALKAGYSVVKKLKDGRMIDIAVDKLLNEFADAMSPVYEEFLADKTASKFESYIGNHAKRASDALLGITDAKAARAESKVIKSTYEKLRSSAEKHVIDALPGVGRLIDTHAPKA